MKKKMRKYLEYRILITPDLRSGSRKRCYTALVPVLGIAADGDSTKEAFENIQKLIVFHLESLRKEGKSLPVEKFSGEIITTARVLIPA